MSKQRLTDEEIVEINDLWNSGYGVNRIAAIIHRPISTVKSVTQRRWPRYMELLGPRVERKAIYTHVTTAKLNPSLVREMRQRHERGESVREIASDCEVCQSTASDAINGKTWRWVK